MVKKDYQLRHIVVEGNSVKCCLPVTVLTFSHPAARSLCDSWATCKYNCSLPMLPPSMPPPPLRLLTRRLNAFCSRSLGHGPYVCRLSVTFVHPTQVIIFRNVMPFGTITIYWQPGNILRRSSRSGTPPSGGGGEWNTSGVAEYSDFWPIEVERLSLKRCK